MPPKDLSIDISPLGHPSALESLVSQDETNHADENNTDLSMGLRKPSHILLQPSSSLGAGNRGVQKLMSHYFDSICRTLSCFDSNHSPLRAEVPMASHQTAHVYHCMLGVAAAHLANFDGQMGVAALEHQGRTIRNLQQQINALPRTPWAFSDASNNLVMVKARKDRYHMLLTTILLGVTANWYDMSANSALYLRGARTLFREWLADENISSDHERPSALNRNQSFIVGSMAYWESLASYIVDQSLDSLNYLSPFCSVCPASVMYPNPGTGICTPLFIYLARVGTLLRQKRILDRLKAIGRASEIDGYYSSLLDDAQDLHNLILEFQTPRWEMIAPTGDVNTPVGHLYDVARIYRLVNLLELYQAFPSLTAEYQKTGAIEEVPPSQSEHESLLFDIATSILSIIRDLPRGSGTFTILVLALVSAGSAIQNSSLDEHHKSTEKMRFSLQAELGEGRRSSTAVKYWREIFHEQIVHTYKQCGISAMLRANDLVKKVWRLSDSDQESATGSSIRLPLHWMDVMTEQQMETLYG